MMDQNEHTGQNKSGGRKGGLSAEQRAAIAEANAPVRRRSEKKRVNEKGSRIRENEQRAVYSESRKKKQTATSNEGSRNDRVKSSTKQRKKDIKRQNNLLAAMLFVIAIALIGVISVFVFRINTVEVINPKEMYSSSAVAEKAGIKEGGSMLMLNGKRAEEIIEKDFPYIEDVEIKRRWPDKIIITLEYAVPAMAVDTGSGYIILNSSCKVLSSDAATFNNPAALVKGVEIVSAVPGETAVFSENLNTSQLSELSNALSECGFTDITCYDLTKISDVVIDIDHRVEVKLGTLASAPEKLKFGKEVIARTAEEDTEHAMVVDLTTEGEAYVRVKNDNNISYNDEPEEITSSVGEMSEEETTASVSQTPAVG